MSENINPLLDFARVVECSVKLPSNGSWYDDDNITFNSIGEVDIKAMLPRDELLMSNPETLISGETIIQVIRSCCPGIKRPEDLYYPDVNSLLLGIHKATYGDTIKVSGICPKCSGKRLDDYSKLLNEKMNNNDDEKKYDAISDECIKEITEKYSELEKENKVNLSYQEHTYNIDHLLSQMTFLPSEKIYESGNGLKIYLTPYMCKDKTLFMLKNNHTKKVLEKMRTKMFDVMNKEDGYIENVDELNKSYVDLSNETTELIASGIKKIEISNGMVVTNKEHIREFIMNTSVDVIKDLNNIIEELTSTGVQKTVPMKCSCCEHEWNELFHKYNPSDFFGISS